MQVCGGGVAGLAGVDDDHGPALTPELEGGGESGRGSADDGDVAVPLEGSGGVVTHDVDDTSHSETRKAYLLQVFARTSGRSDGGARRDRTGGSDPAAEPP